MRRFKAAVIQYDVRLGDLDRNVATVKRRITSLVQTGVQLILLPEMWATGFANDRLRELAGSTPGILDELSKVSRELQVTTIGSLPEKAKDRVYNTAYVVDRDGSITDAYRKVHLFTLTGEDRYFVPGGKAVVTQTSLGPVGLVICYDLRFPELSRSLVLQGANILAVMAQWPAERVAHWQVLLRGRAIENQVFVLGANRCGRDPSLAYAGHSRIISPYGDVMARAGRRPTTLLATIDASLLERTRKHIPCLRDRVPEAYV
ncbi:MAG: carbon-nitrogen family hydrolase [Thermodesulfobacteriota bacterium]|nr:carbon-nitrogen family hydrolase [Thermodesulfobacteriota bacterium]